ncbi:hypothetical protein CANCADRAFT_13135, partial [Tortispora caseinolytica NRRL Y-17796]
WYFTEGLIIGQLSMVLLVIAFIRFFIFTDVPDPTPSFFSYLIPNLRSFQLGSTLYFPFSNEPAKPADVAVPEQETNRRVANAAPSVLRRTPKMSAADILEKTYYNVSEHTSESLDWLNVLLAQSIAKLRDDAQQDNNILKSLNNFLNNEQFTPSFVSTINITELSIGDDFPIFSNCRICPSRDDATQLEALMDVDLIDSITLGIETRLLLNFPAPFMAALPVSLAVTLSRFSGTLTASLKHATDDGQTAFTFSFRPDYQVEFSVRSLIGSRSRIQDVPKISQIVESRIKKWFNERCVQPRFQEISLPSMWPRSKNTRQ